MRKVTETLFRHLALLQLLPVYPKRISVAQLRDKLRVQNADFDVSTRTLQRDLEKLSYTFLLSNDTEGRANYWFWTDKSALIQIPTMGGDTALAFKLAAEHLRAILPPSTLRLLQPYLKHADEVLDKTKLGEWSRKTRIIARGPVLLAPRVAPEVQEAVYAALLEDKQLEVDYRSKMHSAPSKRVLSPLGLVIRGGISYLIATAEPYRDPRHYTLHRMRAARLLDTPANVIGDFDLARYIEQEQGFAYPVSAAAIKLRALFTADAAQHLAESKLSNDQRITVKRDGRKLVEATVADTAELRWWLLGFGGQVEVLSPKGLRDEFVQSAENLRAIYLTRGGGGGEGGRGVRGVGVKIGFFPNS